MVLEVAHFSGGFRSSGEVLPVLKDVSFSAAKSAITALVGETGSGKTLLALVHPRTVAALVRKDVGIHHLRRHGSRRPR